MTVYPNYPIYNTNCLKKQLKHLGKHVEVRKRPGDDFEVKFTIDDMRVATYSFLGSSFEKDAVSCVCRLTTKLPKLYERSACYNAKVCFKPQIKSKSH